MSSKRTHETMSNRRTLWPLGFALVVLAATTGIRKIRAPDYWWHLAAGDWINQGGSVPQVDVFTYTVPGAPWLDIHWLFQVGLSKLYALGGHDGVVIAKAVLIVLLVGVVATIRRPRDRPFVAAFGLGLMILAANDRLLARPELTSFLLLAGVLALLERDVRRGDAGLYAIVLLQLAWVNSHGLFALGIALCGIYTAGEAFRIARGRGEWNRLRRLGLLTALVIVASLANPNFLAGALYPFEQLGMIAPDGAAATSNYGIRELVPLFQAGRSLVPDAAGLLLALFCGIALAANAKHDANREEHVLAFVAFFLLFAMATRNAAVFAVVAAPIWIRSTNDLLERHPLGRRGSVACSVAVFVLLLAASWDLARGTYYMRTRTYHEPGLGFIDLFVVDDAVDWIERERPPGPIAHTLLTGGFINWRLFPDYEVMVDGRLEIFGAKRHLELRLNQPADFERLDAEYRFGTVVLNAGFDSASVISWLVQNPSWRLVHVDRTGVVFVRDDADSEPPWPRVDLGDPDLLPLPTEGIPPTRGANITVWLRLRSALGLR